jgi:hypothetical protein
VWRAQRHQPDHSIEASAAALNRASRISKYRCTEAPARRTPYALARIPPAATAAHGKIAVSAYFIPASHMHKAQNALPKQGPFATVRALCGMLDAASIAI